MKSRRVAFLGLVGFLFVLWFGANGCSLDTTGFGETDPVCTVDAHCDDHIVCTIDKCAENGVCVHTANADGLFPDGVSGNCKAYGCKDGEQAEIQLTDDVDDGNECTKDVCTDTGATHEADTGAPCHMGGGLGKCDADKKCVIACGYKDENGMEVGCPKSDDDCSLSYCDNSVGQCVLDQLDGVAVPGTNPADCGGSYCVKGKTTTSASLADTPCMDTTAGGKPATVCDGAGECVECNSDEQCIPVGTPPSDCFTPKCNANKCENIVKDNVDLPIAQQVPSDCQIKRCDMGLVVSVADDSDKPNDNDNVCTFDVCTNGVPSNPPVPAGTDCGTGAGGNPLVCNAVGVCVGCNSPARLPGHRRRVQGPYVREPGVRRLLYPERHEGPCADGRRLHEAGVQRRGQHRGRAGQRRRPAGRRQPVYRRGLHQRHARSPQQDGGQRVQRRQWLLPE